MYQCLMPNIDSRMCVECLESDADASVVIVSNASTSYKTTPETLANTHRSVGTEGSFTKGISYTVGRNLI